MTFSVFGLVIRVDSRWAYGIDGRIDDKSAFHDFFVSNGE
jgi:hypothetical protein